MASVALGTVGKAVGTYLGGPIGGMIGGFVGSMLGQAVDNQLFPVKTEGPRLSDLTVTSSAYGRPLALIYGPKNRIAGNVFWSTGLIETVRKVKTSGKGGPSVQNKEYSYRASVAISLGEGVLNRIVKVWANTKLIYDADSPPPEIPPQHWSAMRFYQGTFTQTPDPTIEADKGVGNTPAYRGTAYVVIADLQLADYGNQIPNLEFLVEAHEEITAGEIVADFVVRCGLDIATVSTSALRDKVQGYVIGAAASGIAGIQPLAMAYNFDVAEVGGGLRCVKRTASPAGIILQKDLAGHEGGQQRPDVIEWTRERVTHLPKEATITAPDPDRDFQPNSQIARRSQGTADSNLSNELPIVLTVPEAQDVATRALWEAWASQQQATARTDDRWIDLEPARSYYVETPAGLEPLRIVRLQRGVNGVIEIEMKRDRDEVYSSPTDGAFAPVPPNPLRNPGLTRLILLDIPLLVDADNDKPSGFYFGVVGSGHWRGADVIRSIEAGGNFDPMESQGVELTAGLVAGVVPPPPSGFNSETDWDTATVIRITLDRPDMTLEGVSDAEALSGINGMWIGPADGHGGELIRFAEATMISAGVYDISRLRRGQQGTEFAWGSHVAGEIAVLLEIGALVRIDYGVQDLNLARYYKAVSLLTLPEDTPSRSWTNTGTGLRPYAPADLLGELISGGGDIELSWRRRSRIGAGIVPPPLAEEFERFRVDILPPVGTTPRRTVEVNDLTEWTYTAAMQTADFGAPVSSLRWRVAQISAAYGAGAFATAVSVA